MPIIFDANVLVALFRTSASDSEKTRITGLLSDAKTNRKRLLIPSPALSEFAAKALQHELDFLMEQSVFQAVT